MQSLKSIKAVQFVGGGGGGGIDVDIYMYNVAMVKNNQPVL